MTDAFDSGRATGSVPGRAPGSTPGRAPGSATVPPSAPGAASDADLPRGPGQRLRQARLRRGLELRQVAREMRLTVERVQAIEEDDYAALPDPVFVAGYLKTYARLMELNPEPLVVAYRTLQARSPVVPKPRSATILPRVKSTQEGGGAKPAATPLPSGRPRGLGRFGWGAPSPGKSNPGKSSAGTPKKEASTPGYSGSVLSSSGTSGQGYPGSGPSSPGTPGREYSGPGPSRPGSRVRGYDGPASASPSSSPSVTDPGQDEERPQSRSEDRPEGRSKVRPGNPAMGQGRTQDFAWAALAVALFVLLLVLAWWTQRPAPIPESPAGGQGPVAEHLTQPRPPEAEERAPATPVAGWPAMSPGRETLTPSPVTTSPGESEAEIQAEIEAKAGIEAQAGIESESEMGMVPEPVEEEGMQEAGLPSDTPGTPSTLDTPGNPGTPGTTRAPGEGRPVTTTPRPTEADVAQVEERLAVMIRFTGPTSVDIRDSTMNYALVGEMDKGDQYLLGGKPPYSLIIGNAAAVEILVGGKPFDYQSVVRGNVARFILDPAPAHPLPDPPQSRP